MKGKILKIDGNWWVETFNSHKYNFPQEIEVLDYPRNYTPKEGDEVVFEAVSLEDYVGFAGHTGYPTFTTKARIEGISAEKE
jgi:hypothetical protein